MSMSTSIVYGFGFIVDEITDDKLIDFIKNHKDTFCKSPTEIAMYNEILNIPENEIYMYGLTDYFEDYSCNCSGQEGRGAVISNIISRETGIRVQYEMGQSECDSYPSVLLAEGMPWHLNEKEKNLTKESLTGILLSYVEELGLSRDNVEELKIEYYG